MENVSSSHESPFRLLIIVPAYNEAVALPTTLADLKTLPIPYDVLVVNDGSSDATAQVARRKGAMVLDLACNLGVGGAMQAGYQYAHQKGYDAAIQFDADGQHLADQVSALLEPIKASKADMVIGSRGLDIKDYRFSLDRRIGSYLLGRLVSMLLRRRFTDPTSGFRAANRKAISFFGRHYPQAWLGDTVEALVELARHSYRITEVSVRMLPRKAGKSTAGSIMGLLHTLRIVVAVLIDCLEKKFEDEETP